MTSTLKCIAGAALALMLTAQTPSFGHGGGGETGEKMQAQISDVRRATAPFLDVDEAIRAGYVKFPDLAGDCVAQPGQGAMGIHYLNGALISTRLDPLRPAALMYKRAKHDKLALLGVEYIVFQADWDALHPQPPVMFKHPFHLVRSPNRYGVPAFYELHLWVWEHNRDGMFNDWNEAVRCP